MAIVSLDKTQKEPANGDGVEKFRAYSASQLIDNYCDKSTFDNLIIIMAKLKKPLPAYLNHSLIILKKMFLNT